MNSLKCTGFLLICFWGRFLEPALGHQTIHAFMICRLLSPLESSGIFYVLARNAWGRLSLVDSMCHTSGVLCQMDVIFQSPLGLLYVITGVGHPFFHRHNCSSGATAGTLSCQSAGTCPVLWVSANRMQQFPTEFWGPGWACSKALQRGSRAKASFPLAKCQSS